MTEDITTLAAPAILLALMNVLGYAVKKSPLKNWTIPWILMAVAGASYPFISTDCDFGSIRSIVLHVIYGWCIGGGAVGVHQGVTQYQEAANGKIPMQIQPDKPKE